MKRKQLRMLFIQSEQIFCSFDNKLEQKNERQFIRKHNAKITFTSIECGNNVRNNLII
jgi:hypothetical protein